MQSDKAVVRAALHAGSWYTQNSNPSCTQKQNWQKNSPKIWKRLNSNTKKKWVKSRQLLDHMPATATADQSQPGATNT